MRHTRNGSLTSCRVVTEIDVGHISTILLQSFLKLININVPRRLCIQGEIYISV